MEELIHNLGIDWRLLVAQIINFLILLFLLYKFLYKPILNLLEKRSRKIQKSLEDAKKIKEELKKTEETRNKKMAEVQAQVQKIIEEANKNTEEVKSKTLDHAHQESEKIIKKTQEDIKREKEKMLAEVKEELADLVIKTSSKVIEKRIDEKTDKELIEKILKESKP